MGLFDDDELNDLIEESNKIKEQYKPEY